ncbi:MAG: heavy metal translocating P-type ATPase [Methanobacteriales archaeon]|nr:heavy metal translocating P-type ATPase [Methanobacteriales archaeon]
METFKKRLIICTLLTIAIIAIVGFRLGYWATILLSSIIFFYGGYPFFKDTFRELKDRKLGSMSLAIIAITAAYLYIILTPSAGTIPIELAIIIMIILVGRWLGKKLTEKIREPLEEPVHSIPVNAHTIENGKVKEAPTESIRPGDLILVKNGEVIPTDGIIIKGSTIVHPVIKNSIEKTPGETVTATAINIKKPILIEALTTSRGSFIPQLIKILKKEDKTSIRESVDKIASALIIIVIAVAILTFLYWKNMTPALEHAITVLLAASPHAIRLAAPTALLAATIISAKNGIIIKNRKSYETARQLDAIVFNKTGTLTMGQFKVTDIISLDDEIDEGDIINYAAAIESKSQHPIAKGIREVANEPIPAKKSKPIPGKGIKGYVGDTKIQITSYQHIKDLGFQIENPKILEMIDQGKTLAFIIINDELKGCIGLSDKIKKGAKKTIKTLKDKGIKCIMLTGDHKKVAEPIARGLGLDEYHAELTKEEKAKKIEKMQEDGLKVGMIGQSDDTPALKQADLGITMGTGHKLDIEGADIIIPWGTPSDILSILEIATVAHNKIKENLTWAAIYNIIAIPLTTGILYKQINPPLGAALMVLSIIIPILNSKTIIRGEKA